MTTTQAVEHPKTYFHTLPNELISEIFLCTFQFAPELLRDRLPCDLLLVCRRWLTVALKTPRLWSTFQFKLVDDPNLYNKVSKWIERSHPAPLTVGSSIVGNLALGRVRQWQHCHALGGDEVEKLVRRICDGSPRWHVIKLVLPERVGSRCAQAVFDAAQGAKRCMYLDVSFVLLGFITDNNSIGGDDDNNGNATTTELKLVRTMFPLPDISIIRLEGVEVVVEPTRQVESADTVYLDCLGEANSVVRIVESAPNLRNLELKFASRYKSLGEFSGEPAEAPSLVWINFEFSKLTLTVEEGEERNMHPMAVFQAISAPHLTTFCLTERLIHFTHLPSVKSFLQRSSGAGKLKRFHYCGPITFQARLELISDILRCIPSIEQVTIRTGASPVFFRAFLASLSSSSNSTLPLPHLKHFAFEMHQTTFHRVDMSALREFAKERVRKGLETVTLLRSSFHSGKPVSPLNDRQFFEGLHDLGVVFSTKDVIYEDSGCDWEME